MLAQQQRPGWTRAGCWLRGSSEVVRPLPPIRPLSSKSSPSRLCAFSSKSSGACPAAADCLHLYLLHGRTGRPAFEIPRPRQVPAI